MAKKVRREFKSGLQELQDFFGSKIERHMEEMKNNKQTKMGVVLAIIPHIFAIGFTIIVVWIAKPTSSLFSWHPTLMSLAFMVLMVEAILLFSPWFSLSKVTPHNDKIFYHWFLHGCALVCAYTGLAAITYNKYRNQSSHYTSWHGFLGIIVCCAIAVQASGGIIELYPSLLPFKIRKVILKRLHAISGTIVFGGAMIVLVLSMYTTWFSANVPNIVVWGFCCSCPVIIVVAVIVQFIRNHLLLIVKTFN